MESLADENTTTKKPWKLKAKSKESFNLRLLNIDIKCTIRIKAEERKEDWK